MPHYKQELSLKTSCRENLFNITSESDRKKLTIENFEQVFKKIKIYHITKADILTTSVNFRPIKAVINDSEELFLKCLQVTKQLIYT